MTANQLSQSKKHLYDFISHNAADLDKTLVLEKINQLSDSSSILLTNLFEFFSDNRIKAEIVIKSYGVSKFLEIFSKYDFDTENGRLFAFKLAREKGKYAAAPDDLERLAKIWTNTDLSTSQKQSLSGHRDNYQDFESLDTAIKNIIEPKAGYIDYFWSCLGYTNNNELVKNGISDDTTD